jgi:hypothetical protein
MTVQRGFSGWVLGRWFVSLVDVGQNLKGWAAVRLGITSVWNLWMDVYWIGGCSHVT